MNRPVIVRCATTAAPVPPGLDRARWERLTATCRRLDAWANQGAGAPRKDC